MYDDDSGTLETVVSTPPSMRIANALLREHVRMQEAAHLEEAARAQEVDRAHENSGRQSPVVVEPAKRAKILPGKQAIAAKHTQKQPQRRQQADNNNGASVPVNEQLIAAPKNTGHLESERAKFGWNEGRLWPILKTKRPNHIEDFAKEVLRAEEKEEYIVSLLVEFRLLDSDFDVHIAHANGQRKTIEERTARLFAIPEHVDKLRPSFQESKRHVEKWKSFFECIGRHGTLPFLNRLSTWFTALCKVIQLSVRESVTLAALYVVSGALPRLRASEEKMRNDVRDAAERADLETRDHRIVFRKKMLEMLYCDDVGMIRDECPMIRLDCIRAMYEWIASPSTPFAVPLWIPNTLPFIVRIIHFDPSVNVRRHAVLLIHQLMTKREFTSIPLHKLPHFNVLVEVLLHHMHDNDQHIQINCLHILGEIAKKKNFEFKALELGNSHEAKESEILKLLFHQNEDISDYALRFFDYSVFPKPLESSDATEFHETVLEFMCDIAEKKPYLATRLVGRTKYLEKWNWSTLVKLLENPSDEWSDEMKKKRQNMVLALMDAVVRSHPGVYDAVTVLQDVHRILQKLRGKCLYCDSAMASFMLYCMAECALKRVFDVNDPVQISSDLLALWETTVIVCLTEFSEPDAVVVASRMLTIVPEPHWNISSHEIMEELVTELSKCPHNGDKYKFGLSALARFHPVPSSLLVTFDQLERRRFAKESGALPNWFTLQFYAMAALQRPERAHGVQWIMLETLGNEINADKHAKAVAFESLLAFDNFLHGNGTGRCKNKKMSNRAMMVVLDYLIQIVLNLPKDCKKQTAVKGIVPPNNEIGFLCDLLFCNVKHLDEDAAIRLFVIHSSHILNTLELHLSRRVAFILLVADVNSTGFGYLVDELIRKLRELITDKKLQAQTFWTIVFTALQSEHHSAGGANQETARVLNRVDQIAHRVASYFFFINTEYANGLRSEILRYLEWCEADEVLWMRSIEPLLKRLEKRDFADILVPILESEHIKKHEVVGEFFESFYKRNSNAPEVNCKRAREDVNTQGSNSREGSPKSTGFITPSRSRTGCKRVRTNSRTTPESPSNEVRLPPLELSVRIDACTGGSQTPSAEQKYACEAQAAANGEPASPISIDASSDEGDDSPMRAFCGAGSVVSDATPRTVILPKSIVHPAKTQEQATLLDAAQQPIKTLKEKLGGKNKRKKTYGDDDKDSQTPDDECAGSAGKNILCPTAPTAQSKTQKNAASLHPTTILLADNTPTQTSMQNIAQGGSVFNGDERPLTSIEPDSQATTQMMGKRDRKPQAPFFSPPDTENSLSHMSTLIGQNRPLESVSPTIAGTQVTTTQMSSQSESQKRNAKTVTQDGKAATQAPNSRKGKHIKLAPSQSAAGSQASDSNARTLIGQNRAMESVSPTIAGTQVPTPGESLKGGDDAMASQSASQKTHVMIGIQGGKATGQSLKGRKDKQIILAPSRSAPGSQASDSHAQTLIGQNRAMESVSPTIAGTQVPTPGESLKGGDDAMASQSTSQKTHVMIGTQGGKATGQSLKGRKGKQIKLAPSQSVPGSQASDSHAQTLIGQNRAMESVGPTIAGTQVPTPGESLNSVDDAVASQSTSKKTHVMIGTQDGKATAQSLKGRKGKQIKLAPPQSAVGSQVSDSRAQTSVGQNRRMARRNPTTAVKQNTLRKLKKGSQSTAAPLDLFEDDGLAPSKQTLLFEEKEEEDEEGSAQNSEEQQQRGELKRPRHKNSNSLPTSKDNQPKKRVKAGEVEQDIMQLTSTSTSSQRQMSDSEDSEKLDVSRKTRRQSPATFAAPRSPQQSTFTFGSRGQSMRSLQSSRKSIRTPVSENSPRVVGGKY